MEWTNTQTFTEWTNTQTDEQRVYLLWGHTNSKHLFRAIVAIAPLDARQRKRIATAHKSDLERRCVLPQVHKVGARVFNLQLPTEVAAESELINRTFPLRVLHESFAQHGKTATHVCTFRTLPPRKRQ
jgi:hypothetical protein